MKKILILILLLFVTNSFCQNPYYDAVVLRNLINNGTGQFDATDDEKLKLAGSLLYKYLNPPHPSIEDASFDVVGGLLQSGPNENPFLKNLIPSGGNGSSALASMPFGMKNFDLGATNVTNFADGLAKFLVKRAKQELLISFFNNLKDAKKNPEFAILFPNSKLLVDNFDTWQYANIINTLREALQKDLKQLLGSIPKLSGLNPDAEGYSESVKKRVAAIKTFMDTDDGRIFRTALNIGNGFLTNQKIPDIIHSFNDTANGLTGISTLSADGINIIKLLDILSLSIRSNTFGKSYVSTTEFNTMISDPITRKLYFGLLYQQIKGAGITISGANVATLLAASSADFETYITSLVSNAENITRAYEALSEARKKGETDLSGYWGVLFENGNIFFQNATSLQVIHTSFILPPAIQKVMEKVNSTLEIASEISNKNYSAAVVSTLNFISVNVPSDGAGDFKAYFVRYGSFAANVVQAKDSDEVEKAIESAALPVGSASIKKKTTFSIALNAYLGGFYGNEYLADKESDEWGVITGVYAPVGVTFNWGLNSKKCNYGSLSALINVIDIGAIASYRLQDSSTDKLPEVTLQNILAPGIGLVYGMPGFPLSIGYSYQFGPALRNINETVATTAQANRRWQFFIGVDIPLLNFYAKSK